MEKVEAPSIQRDNLIVVTNENYKPNSAQLPNLCEELDVSCISYDDFMAYLDELYGDMYCLSS